MWARITYEVKLRASEIYAIWIGVLNFAIHWPNCMGTMGSRSADIVALYDQESHAIKAQSDTSSLRKTPLYSNTDLEANSATIHMVKVTPKIERTILSTQRGELELVAI